LDTPSYKNPVHFVVPEISFCQKMSSVKHAIHMMSEKLLHHVMINCSVDQWYPQSAVSEPWVRK